MKKNSLLLRKMQKMAPQNKKKKKKPSQTQKTTNPPKTKRQLNTTQNKQTNSKNIYQESYLGWCYFGQSGGSFVYVH